MENVTKYISILLSLFSLSGIMSTRTDILHFKFLCYENTQYFNKQGYGEQTIDYNPYFIICISAIQNSINCSILFVKSETFINQKKVCYQPQDNRGSLQSEMSKSVSFPIQNTFYVKILVKTATEKSGLIFYAKFAPKIYSSKVIYSEIKMQRIGLDSKNLKTSLTIAMALKCGDSKDKTCGSACPPVLNKNYECTKNGEIVCKKGFDCTKWYISCRPNPCKNFGQCLIVPTDRKYLCKCKKFYFGDRCELIDICSLEPCLNGGVCKYNKNNIRFCQCHRDYTGKLCDQARDSRPNTSHVQIIIWTVICISIVLIVIITVLVFFCYLRPRLAINRDINHGQEIKLNPASQSLLNDPVAFNNRFTRPMSENVYVSINEAETNSAILDLNEYDLLPRSPIYTAPINVTNNHNYSQDVSPAKVIKNPSVSKFV